MCCIRVFIAPGCWIVVSEPRNPKHVHSKGSPVLLTGVCFLLGLGCRVSEAEILSKSPCSDATVPGLVLLHPAGDFWLLESSLE